MAATLTSERSSGDGMESLTSKAHQVEGNEFKRIDVHKYGSIHQSLIGESRRHALAANFTSPPKLKEPKFVPYEPYKAAVTPMVVNYGATGLPQIPQCKSLKTICGIRHMAGLKKTSRTDDVQLKPCKCVEENQKLSEELEILREENKSLESQLQIQAQVNKELKNLLVASVGEDMQAKVQFLTEDKTKLAQDILTYSEKLMEETEAIEKLSIQCDVWRSKYLASSLIVDELAGWKAVLDHHLNEATETIKLLLKEIDIYRTQNKALSLRNDTNIAYEHVLETGKRHHKSEDMIKVSAEIEDLTARLMKLMNFAEGVDDNHCLKLSRGEKMANKLLAHTTLLTMMKNEGRLPLENWPSLTGKLNIASRFHPCTRFEGFTYHCCHCKGEIKIL